MFRRKHLYIITLLALTACWESSPYEGFSETSTGLYYQLHTIGDGEVNPKEGDYMWLSITYKTVHDSIFLDSYSYNNTGKVILPFNQSSFKGSFEEGLANMNAGDTYTFIVDADSLFEKFFKAATPTFLQKEGMVKMDVNLHRILNKKEYRKTLKKYVLEGDNKGSEETLIVKQYLDTCSLTYTALSNGMYVSPLTEGQGSTVKGGDVVSIHYTGSFFNGAPFESTYEYGQALEFTFGKDGQVIKGIERAISLMNEGAKRKFILPSQLAFGKQGSSTHIVPPFTSVVYEIELLTIN